MSKVCTRIKPCPKTKYEPKETSYKLGVSQLLWVQLLARYPWALSESSKSS